MEVAIKQVKKYHLIGSREIFINKKCYIKKYKNKEKNGEKSLKVLVTGGAGHIGYHIVERLLERGDQVL